MFLGGKIQFCTLVILRSVTERAGIQANTQLSSPGSFQIRPSSASMKSINVVISRRCDSPACSFR